VPARLEFPHQDPILVWRHTDTRVLLVATVAIGLLVALAIRATTSSSLFVQESLDTNS
jgi:hypothetical protein